MVNFTASQSIPINLPGIGLFIDAANNTQNFVAGGAAIVAMLITIVLYDQLLFRPLVAWSEKFVIGDNPSETHSKSWFLTILHKAYVVKVFTAFLAKCSNKIVNIKIFLKNLDKAYNQKVHKKAEKHQSITKRVIWNTIIVLMILALLYFVYQTVYAKDKDIGIEETLKVFNMDCLQDLELQY